MNKQKWIECAASKGIEAFEIYQAVSREKKVTWYDGQMDTFVTSDVTGTSVRGTVGGKMANIALEYTGDEIMEKTLEQLAAQAQAVTSEDNEVLRKPEDAIETAKESRWVSPSMDEIKELLKKMEQKCLAFDERIVQAELEWIEEADSREITNSLGMNVHDEDKAQLLVISTAAKQGEEAKTEFTIEPVRCIADLDTDALAKKACEGALKKLGSTSMPSGNYRVIIEKHAMTSLFSALSGMYSGELIFKGISPLKDSLGKKIMSEQITVVDHPGNPEAMSQAVYDDEGCPTRRKVLVENGVFQQMLHSTKSALQMNTESTGNGFKNGYASAVSIQPKNCCIMPGEHSLEEMCETMQDGLVITDLAGLHAGLNPVTTNFSLLSSGYVVKNGKRDHAVSLITCAANYLDLMNHVVEVGNDLEWSYHSIVCPSIAFESIAVSGE